MFHIWQYPPSTKRLLAFKPGAQDESYEGSWLKSYPEWTGPESRTSPQGRNPPNQ